MQNIAVIPVRSGSKRLPKKNYLPFNSRTLLEVAIKKCLDANIFDKIIVTSDDTYFAKFAKSEHVAFLERDQSLCSDDATTDAVVDFLFKKLPSCESILWVNSVSPLQTTEDIKHCASRLNDPEVDCVMAVNTLYQHCCIEGKPINFSPNSAFEATQSLKPVTRYVYSCMGWKRGKYLRQREKGFRGLFPGKLSLVEVSMLAGMLIKYEKDFLLCSIIEEAMKDFGQL